MLAQQSLGQGKWQDEIRSTLRQGMRQQNLVDFGGLTVGRVGANVILSDGAWVEFPIALASEAAAVIEFQRLVSGLNRGQTIQELLPSLELPAEIVNAWVR